MRIPKKCKMTLLNEGQLEVCSSDPGFHPFTLIPFSWRFWNFTEASQHSHGCLKKGWNIVETYLDPPHSWRGYLGGRFKEYFIFTPNPGEMIQFDEHIFWLQKHQLIY